MSITVIYHAMPLTVLYHYHQDEWYVYHSDLSHYASDDMSITVIYHAMPLTVLYHYHQDEWYVYHSDLSCYVSDCTVYTSFF